MYQEITVEELAQWRDDDRSFVLLDVRNNDEVTMAALPGAVHIPMPQLPDRISELDATTTIAVLCHHGNRSARVAQYLTGSGFADVFNVEGGIDAYALRIDTSIPRY